MATTTQFCTFHVGHLFLGVDVLSVHEVLRASELARVPLAPDVVEGLLNLRGQIVTTVDLRRRFKFEPRADQAGMFLIVDTTDGPMAFIVDSVGDVCEVDASSFEQAPATLPATARALIKGVHKLPQSLLHVLDCDHAATLTAA